MLQLHSRENAIVIMKRCISIPTKTFVFLSLLKLGQSWTSEGWEAGEVGVGGEGLNKEGGRRGADVGSLEPILLDEGQSWRPCKERS